MGAICSCEDEPDKKTEILLNIPRKSEHDVQDLVPIYVDPIQLESYEWDDHRPDPEFAIPLARDEEKDFHIQELAKTTLKRHHNVNINAKLSDNYKKIPKNDAPYKIIKTEQIYVGQWLNGKPYGIGAIYYKQGDIYQGQTIDGIPEGEGMKIETDGSYYIGDFKNGLMEGYGKMKRSDRFHYDGYWKNNVPHGKGTEVWPNQTVYTGSYVDGIKCGRGRFAWSEIYKTVIQVDNTDKKSDKKDQKKERIKLIQEQYDGNFENNLFDGYGTYEWPDGRTYEGCWKAGQMNGHGIFHWVDGKKFDGQYRADSKHGKGTLILKDGNKLKGYWRFGRLEGRGILEINGKNYEGEWVNGKRVKWIYEQVNDSVAINTDITLAAATSQKDGQPNATEQEISPVQSLILRRAL